MSDSLNTYSLSTYSLSTYSLSKALVIATLLLSIGFSSMSSASDINAENLLNMNVVEKGVYQISFEQLRSYGVDIEFEPIERLAVMNRGESVAIEVRGSTNRPLLFGDGAYVRFIAESIDTIYTDTNVYTLRLDSAAQRLMVQQAVPLQARAPYAVSYLASKSFAPQMNYSLGSPDPKDPWYAKRILALDKPAAETVPIMLDDYAPGGNSGSVKANMRLKVWGASDMPGDADDHHVKVRFNGVEVLDQTFEGLTKKDMSAPVSNLQVGLNYVSLELPLDQGHRFEAINIDSVEVLYPRAFVAVDNALNFVSSLSKFRIRGFTRSDISVYRKSQGVTSRLSMAESGGSCQNGSPRCSVRFSASRGAAEFFAVTDGSVKTPELAPMPLEQNIRADNAEYLIITHPDFIASGVEADLLGGLAKSLEDQFSSVDIVDVEQIYAQFGDHIFDPSAIQKYIKYAHQNRGTQLVLLVGGDVYDYRGFENSDARSFIPSIYVSTGDVVNFAPVDAKYVDLDDNNTPDLPIGRLPVRTMGELGVLLAKRDAYLARDYRDRVLFSADVFDDLNQYSFKLDAQTIEHEFFDGWDVRSAYPDDLGIRASREKIAQEINAGVSLTSFFGHSSTAQWSFNGLFNGIDASRLQNVGRPTIVTQWGCWNTYYVNPNEDSMGHRFMMEGDQGAVAVLGATTLTSASNEKILSRLVFERLSNGEPLGQAMTNGKAEFARNRTGALDVILGWTLLGFPELSL